MAQLNLDDYTQTLEAVIRTEGKQTTEQKLETFEAWAKRNPEALSLMYQKALALHYTHNGFSIKYLIEWMRYEGCMQLTATKDGVPEDAYKVPNAFAPIIARLFVRRSPELREVLVLHKSEFDGHELPEVVW